MNEVINLGYVFVTRFHITFKKFLDNWTDSSKVTALIFFVFFLFENGIFKIVRKF